MVQDLGKPADLILECSLMIEYKDLFQPRGSQKDSALGGTVPSIGRDKGLPTTLTEQEVEVGASATQLVNDYHYLQ